MTSIHVNNTYQYNQEEEPWDPPLSAPIYPSLVDTHVIINNTSSTLPTASSITPQTTDYPSLYTTILVDPEGKDRREREGREEDKRDGIETVYHTTPYPPPTRAFPSSSSPSPPASTSANAQEGSSPYPSVQIWRPPSAKWYQKQAVGKFFGKIHIVVGSLVFKDYLRHFVFGTVKRASLLSFEEDENLMLTKYFRLPPPGAVIAGVLCIGFGIYLHAKKYLRDPKAILRYRQKIFAPTTPFQSVVDEYGWDHLFVIATKEELCYKLYQEMQNVRGLYQICSIYKVNNLKAYLKYDVMRAIDVEARWEYDVLRAADGTGPELAVVVYECGDFLLTASNVQAEKIRESLESDPTMLRSSFAEIFERFSSGIHRIVSKGFLSPTFLRKKLLHQLSTDPAFKFTLIAHHRWIVDETKHNICSPQEISQCFRVARENCACVVSFLETYWIWPIERYQTQIIQDSMEYSKLKQIHDEFSGYPYLLQAFQLLFEDARFKKSIKNDIQHINKRYEENVEEARRAKERKSQQINTSTTTKIVELQMNPQKEGFSMDAINAVYARQRESLEKFSEEERAIQRQEKQAMEDQTRQADKQLENKKIALHKEWNAFLAQRKSYNSPPLSHNPSFFTPQYAPPTAPSAPFL